jgi:hypothetical protein
MTRLATILLCAWVLWMEVYSLKEGAREWSPLSAYPADSYQACLDGAKAHVETQVEGYTAENRSVMRYSRGGRETVTADLKPKGIYHWTFRCVPDTLDPRAKR